MENPNWTLSRADFEPYRCGTNHQDACETTDTEESSTSSVGTEPFEHSTPIPSPPHRTNSSSSTDSSDENFIRLRSISHKRSKSSGKKRGAKMRRRDDPEIAGYSIETAAANRGENYPNELTLNSCLSRPSRSREAAPSSSSSQRIVRYFSSQTPNHQE